MRIGIDASGIFGWRGPTRNIINIIKSLIINDDVNDYFLFSPLEPNIVLPAKKNYHWVVLPKKRFVPWLSVSLPIMALHKKIDIFLFPQANYWLIKPTKTVVLTRAATIEPWKNTIYDRLSTNIRKMLFKHIPDRIGCVSHYNAIIIQFVFGIDERKIEIINNGIDPAFLDATVKPYIQPVRYILFTGGTEPRKNIHNLLRAYKIVADKIPDVALMLVGGKYTQSEPDLKEYTNLTNALQITDRVVLYGIEKDSQKLASLYRGSLITVYPSLQEDFGMVSVEAMACGSPLVASNAPSIPEIAGDAAIYFDPYDPADMAKKIELVLSDDKLRNELIARGYERAKKYDWNASARKLIAVLEEVVQGK